MAGCFGNSFEDRYRERELDRYLASLEDTEEHEEDEDEKYDWQCTSADRAWKEANGE